MSVENLPINILNDGFEKLLNDDEKAARSHKI